MMGAPAPLLGTLCSGPSISPHAIPRRTALAARAPLEVSSHVQSSIAFVIAAADGSDHPS